MTSGKTVHDMRVSSFSKLGLIQVVGSNGFGEEAPSIHPGPRAEGVGVRQTLDQRDYFGTYVEFLGEARSINAGVSAGAFRGEDNIRWLQVPELQQDTIDLMDQRDHLVLIVSH